MTRYPRSPTVRGACVVVAATTAAAVLAIVDPATAAWMPPCLWRSATGWLCPGCGSARAVHALLHGHVSAALQLNPLMIATLPFATLDVVNRIRGRGPAPSSAMPGRTGYVILAIVVIFGLARNVLAF